MIYHIIFSPFLQPRWCSTSFKWIHKIFIFIIIFTSGSFLNKQVEIVLKFCHFFSSWQTPSHLFHYYLSAENIMKHSLKT